MVNKEFFEALAEIVETKGIEETSLIESIENALSCGYKRLKGDAFDVKVKLNKEKNSIKFYTVKMVVETVENPDKEITLEDAKAIKRTAKLGEVVELSEIMPKDEFDRISSGTAIQVIRQKLREAERDNIVNEFEDKENAMQTCIIRKVENKNVYVEIGNGQVGGIMLPQDQVPGEKYNVGDKVKVFVKRVKNDGFSAQVLVSRSSSGLVRRLFENEVPEIRQGIVEIKSIAREPGQRTKIAIYSEDKSIDAVGACVGPKGTRVNAIVEELRGEKIDIILWSENPLEYIAKALSPAKVLKVSANEGEQVARVVVPDDKLSLAIGKNGQNARLAVRLTGWKIDIKSESVARASGDYEEYEEGVEDEQ